MFKDEFALLKNTLYFKAQYETFMTLPYQNSTLNYVNMIE